MKSGLLKKMKKNNQIIKIMKCVCSFTLLATLIISNQMTQLQTMAADYSSLTSVWETKGNGMLHEAKTSSDILRLIKTIQPGDTIEIADGNYIFLNPVVINSALRGKISAPKTLRAKNPGKVVFDFSSEALANSNRGVVLDSSFWHIEGIEIKNAGDNGMLLSGNYNVVERCVFSGNRDSGLQVSHYSSANDTLDTWPAYNLIKNCSAHDNCDSSGENADGFAAKLTCGYGNVFDGCLAYNNSDDGWDLFEKPETGTIGIVTIKNCMAFRNGLLSDGSGTAQGDMNGFKLGSSYAATRHRVINCIAFENGAAGFTDNGNHDAIELSYCTSVNNKKANYVMNREVGGINKNLLSVVTDAVGNNDTFMGSLSNSLYYNKNVFASSKELNYVGDAKEFSGAGIVYDSRYQVTENDFETMSLPASGSVDFDSYLRDENGNLNLDGFLKIKNDSPLATLAEDGGCIGARIGQVDAFDIDTLASDIPEEEGDDDETDCDVYSFNAADYLKECGITDSLNEFKPMTGPDSSGIFTLTNWKVPSKTIDMVALRGDMTPCGLFEIDAPTDGTLTLKVRSSGADDIADVVLRTSDGTVIEENSHITQIFGNHPTVLVYELPQKDIYALTYPENTANLKDIRILSAQLKCLPAASEAPVQITATPTVSANGVVGSKSNPQPIVAKGKIDVKSFITVSGNVTGKIKYMAADKKILSINSKGVVKAKKSGSTYVAAFVKQNGSYKKVSNSYFMKVEVPVVKKKVTAAVGKPFKVSELIADSSTTLSVNNIAIANSSVAALDNGVVTPLTGGSTKLTFEIGSVKYKVTIKVN